MSKGLGERFGSQIDFAEPSWYRGFPSPFYNDSHIAWRNKLREFVEKEIKPHVSEWEARKSVPHKEICKKMAKEGIYGTNYPAEFGSKRFPEYDEFHSLIASDEFARIGAGGVNAALFVGVGIGLGPVVNGAKTHIKERVAREVLNADKFICLAITEAHAGSDVGSIRTRAVLSEDGKYYIVNGEKKFITGAAYADYFTTAVQTDSGVSVLLVEKTEGVKVRRLETQGWLSSNTGYVTFENVKVPVENLIGEEGQGFKIIMTNFNGERMGMAISSIRYARMCLEESVTYALKRNTFGRKLWSSPIIRAKVAEMAKRIESSWSWAESIAYATKQKTKQADLAGSIALLKVQSTQCYEFCAREASQIFGGASYLRSGVGEVVERLYREVRVQAIGGGSEEIMQDLAMRRLKAKL